MTFNKRKIAILLIAVPTCIVCCIGVYFYLELRATLPEQRLSIELPGLDNQVRVFEDALGIPTIEGETVLDQYRVQGWITARDRLFQMDLTRRRSAGQLSEIFGLPTLGWDRWNRLLGLSIVAQKTATDMHPAIKDRFQAYADGINEFIKQGPLPPEFGMLGYKPKAWTVADSVLVVLAMFQDLNIKEQLLPERTLSRLEENRSKDVIRFLTPGCGFLDAPLFADAKPCRFEIPPKQSINLRKEKFKIIHAHANLEPPPVRGSNAWVVSGKHTQSGKPILAGDPHLTVGVPVVWYRVQLKGKINASGASLPGVPGVIIGTNGAFTWTFTNGFADTLDLVRLDSPKLSVRTEEIQVKGEQSHQLTIEESEWGPVYENRNGKKFAIQWVARNHRLLSQIDVTPLNLAQTLPQWREACRDWAGPVQNLIFANKNGAIGWALVGNIPKRKGFSGKFARSRNNKYFWDGYLPKEKLPFVLNPKSGIIFNGNQRMLPMTKENGAFGTNWSSPSRAYRIRERLLERSSWTPTQMLEIQFDTHSHLMLFYKEALLSALKRQKSLDKWLAEVQSLIAPWDGNVSPDSKAYPFLRSFRTQLFANLLDPIWKLPQFADPWLGNNVWPLFDWYEHEPTLKTLLEQQPQHLLTSAFESYEEAVLNAASVTAKNSLNNPPNYKSFDGVIGIGLLFTTPFPMDYLNF